jgi:aspartate carbamoyltransferase catalytic subunit
MLKNIISAKQFDKQTIEEIFRRVDLVKSGKYDSNTMSGKIMSTLFYEPSTRTRLSFESSMLRLGGGVISTESAAEFSSASKGETLEDTIRVVNAFSDVIVLRHFAAGASEIAQKYSKVPIINAGDGNGEHPSQALLDLYTIFSKFSGKDITVAMVGDLLNGRTIHSLSVLLSLYPKIRLIFVSPQALAIPNNLKAFLKNKKIKFSETLNLETALKNADVIYQTRIQKERFKNETDYIKFKGLYILDKNSLKQLKKKAVIMHPLPRVNEITSDVDRDPRAIYFEQVQNGLYVRMALLLYLFDKSSAKTR